MRCIIRGNQFCFCDYTVIRRRCSSVDIGNKLCWTAGKKLFNSLQVHRFYVPSFLFPGVKRLVCKVFPLTSICFLDGVEVYLHSLICLHGMDRNSVFITTTHYNSLVATLTLLYKSTSYLESCVLISDIQLLLAGTLPTKTVKVTEVKFTLEQATKAQSGSRCIALLFLQPRR